MGWGMFVLWVMGVEQTSVLGMGVGCWQAPGPSYKSVLWVGVFLIDDVLRVKAGAKWFVLRGGPPLKFAAPPAKFLEQSSVGCCNFSASGEP